MTTTYTPQELERMVLELERMVLEQGVELKKLQQDVKLKEQQSNIEKLELELRNKDDRITKLEKENTELKEELRRCCPCEEAKKTTKKKITKVTTS